MGLQKEDKLNQLLTLLPEGVAAPSGWLNDLGISRQLVHKYVQNGWLVAFGNGVYGRPGIPLRVEGALLGLHRLAQKSCHLSGITALNRQGYAHYLPLGGEPVWHVTTSGSIPAWAKNLTLKPALSFQADSLFLPMPDNGFIGWSTGVRDWILPVSSPERAMLEMLDDAKDAAGFRHAAEIFESMATLRPAKVSALLRSCRSVKAKRLFLFLAEHNGHAWLRKLNTQGIDLGKGKRQFVKGGRLDPKYAITIPKDFSAASR